MVILIIWKNPMQQVEVINDGAWQHTQPSYVEIYGKGKMYLRTVANYITP